MKKGLIAGIALALGTLTFDGNGGVIGNLTMTAADGGQFSCGNMFIAGGSYTLPAPASGPGLGTLVLPLTAGSINFNLVVPSPDGRSAEAIQSDNGSLVAGTTFLHYHAQNDGAEGAPDAG